MIKILKICMITGTLPNFKCGVGDYTDILCSKLNESDKIELSVITTKGLSKNKDYLVYDIVNDWSFKDLKNIINKLSEIKPDIVHIQYPTILYKKNIMINFLPFFIRIKNFKIVLTLHEFTDMSLQAKIRVIPNIYFCDRIVIVDRQYEKDIHKLVFLKNKNIRFINIGSNIPKVTISEEEKIKLREKILDSRKYKIAGFFGFVNNNKNMQLILDAFKKLKNENKLATKFIIIGELNKNDDYQNKIIKFIKNNGLGEYIISTGYLEKNNVAKYINVCDYFILPFKDGLSTKNGSFLAAMQENKLIITTSKNGYKVFNSERIIYLNKDDKDELADIVFKMQNNVIHNEKVGNDKNLFSWDDIVTKQINEYINLLKL